MAAKTTRGDFEQVFPALVKDLLGEAKKFNLPDNALQWFEKVGFVFVVGAMWLIS